MDFFLSKTNKKDGSRSFGMFRKGKTRIIMIAKFHCTDLVICRHSRERKGPSYRRIKTLMF